VAAAVAVVVGNSEGESENGLIMGPSSMTVLMGEANDDNNCPFRSLKTRRHCCHQERQG
jgi:hypothetical protein